MAADFQRRFWIALALTLQILALSPMLQGLVGLRAVSRFAGDLYLLFALSSAVFWYGGWPFLRGLVRELRAGRPGMMTLVAVAITTAYAYSGAVVLGLNLWWATGYNALAIPLAAGALYAWGVLLSPALGAVLMSVSTVIVAVNARRLRLAS